MLVFPTSASPRKTILRGLTCRAPGIFSYAILSTNDVLLKEVFLKAQPIKYVTFIKRFSLVLKLFV